MSSRVKAIVVAVVIPLLALGAFVLAGGGGGSNGAKAPAKLPIALGASAERSSMAAADIALYPYGGIVYEAASDLPSLDGTGRAYEVVVDEDQIRRLRDALQTDGGTFDRFDGSYSWNFSRQSLDRGVASGAGVSSSWTEPACAPDTKCEVPHTTIPARPANLPSKDAAVALASDLLRSVGFDVDSAAVTVDDFTTQWSVRFDPIVDGVATEGFSTTIVIGDGGVVEYAYGMAGRPEPADEYPLVGTRVAIDKLNQGLGFVGAVPLAAADTPVAAVATDTATADAIEDAPTTSTTALIDPSGGVSGSPGDPGVIEPAPPLLPCDGTGAPTTFPCTDVTIEPLPPEALEPQRIVLTEAERILLAASSYDGRELYLVPGYRFGTADGLGPSVLAIDESFLAPPPDAIVPPASDGGSAPGGSGAIEPQPAPAPEPVPETTPGREPAEVPTTAG